MTPFQLISYNECVVLTRNAAEKSAAFFQTEDKRRNQRNAGIAFCEGEKKNGRKEAEKSVRKAGIGERGGVLAAQVASFLRLRQAKVRLTCILTLASPRYYSQG